MIHSSKPHRVYQYRIRYEDKYGRMVYGFAYSMDEAKTMARKLCGEIQRRTTMGRFVKEGGMNYGLLG